MKSAHSKGGVCAACVSVAKPDATPFVFTSDMGLKNHISTHLTHGVSIPEQFWLDYPHIRLCMTCPSHSPTVFVSTKLLSTCGKCRKSDRKVREQANDMPSRGAKTGLPKPSSAAGVSVHDLPTLEQLFARPHSSAKRIPAPVRVRWSHMYSRLLSEARYQNDYKHWLLVFMFEKNGLVAPKRGGTRHKGHYTR